MTGHGSDRVFPSEVAALYDELLVPLIFEPYATALADRLRELEAGDLLEVAAGTGVLTRALAAALPRTVALTATDLNQAMLDRAIAVGTARPVHWQQADVAALPFEAHAFDVVTCQFGVMFFPKPHAFAEVHRVLRPGGRFVFNVWDDIARNEFADVVTDAMRTVFPSDPPVFLRRTPHGYHDPDRIRADLRAGGFASHVDIERVDARSTAATARDVAVAYCEGTPLRGEITARGADRLDEAVAVATEALAARFGATALDSRISALVVTTAA